MKKAPDPVDRHVGHRVRVRRLLIGVSQERLGDALGVTFQQIQKYEKGANRISASRLNQISEMLGVPVSFFYEGAPRQDGMRSEEGGAEAAADPVAHDVLWTSQDLQLVRAFQRIGDNQVRRRIISLVEAIGAGEAPPDDAP
ncbi:MULTISPECIES: helix-turn-helix transcriptional regulator [Methylobacterium]|uniref:Cro/Cl family transcriptional regulator n=2 Tax=Methylobacterium TaxID=407 RepID=A0A0C6FZC4_9HYPH|nr:MULTISPECIES: helix-turn-helix transcriptional regulator [Methylobacterium]MBZ6413778.1 helix-turn-helix transcriptional regulator [Methylobacterium sp.]MBK3395926.1 helix-turn-helix transcriptional regulator [Methylobacterium ajmalii]MBK3412105.1 helix-turn-helix transcriptional regulator [Methylobacterium ajmalii]MBK3425736.1 helix-turn-helix transcriptional regulator [Methylobacterium ajmalii]SFF38906.1 Transcriptional regulator, contains XRE-family HTH domain [Methylobacterium sp. yr596